MSRYAGFHTTESAPVKTGSGGIHSVTLTAGADAATVILYDNISGSGTVICKLNAALTTSHSIVLDVPFSVGCYAALTGTSPNLTVSYW